MFNLVMDLAGFDTLHFLQPEERGEHGGAVNQMQMTKQPSRRSWLSDSGLFRFGPLGGGLLGSVYFFWIFDPRIVRPTWIDWLMSGDRASHFLGWLYFLYADWSFPVGRIDDYISPVGGYMAFTDSIPCLAVIFKILAPLWNQPFQYSGLWMLCCFFLQGWFGALLARRFSGSFPVQLLAAAFFVLSPLLLWRSGHIALNGQFLVLAAIHLYLSSSDLQDNSGKLGGGHTARWTLLCAFSAGVHPYLAMMVLLIYSAACLQIWLSNNRLRQVHVAIALLLPVVTSLAVFYVFGFFSVGSISEDGFGKYSANLDTLINPVGRTLFFRGWPVQRGQYEGVGYLGAGVLFLVLVCAVTWLLRPGRIAWIRFRTHLPLTVVIGGMFVYALATPVYWHRHLLMRLDWFYQHLDIITDTFRVSGRFVWPLASCATLWVLAFVARRFEPRWRVVILVVAVALQFADVSNNQRGRDRRVGGSDWNTLKDDIWNDIGRDHDSLVLVPPFIVGRYCWPNDYRHDDYVPFAYLAATRGMTCNSGYMARVPEEAVTRSCQSLLEQLQAGVVDPRAAYIVHEQYLAVFRWWTGDELVHRDVDGYHLFTSTPVTPPAVAGPVRYP